MPRLRSCLAHNESQDLTLQKGEGYSSSLPIVKVSTKTSIRVEPPIVYHFTLKSGNKIESCLISSSAKNQNLQKINRKLVEIFGGAVSYYPFFATN